MVGVSDYKKLTDDLPNKIRDVLGIMAEVNLHEENESITNSKYQAVCRVSKSTATRVKELEDKRILVN
ncbi:MAG: hypothetical protein ABJA66_20365 [Actinomycetota bacterium]